MKLTSLIQFCYQAGLNEDWSKILFWILVFPFLSKDFEHFTLRIAYSCVIS